jgi:hypothetical protein
MSYTDIREEILGIARDVIGFSDAEIGYEDYQPLNAGVSRALIVRYRGFEALRDTFGGTQQYVWEFELEHYTPFLLIEEAARARDEERERILAAFNRDHEAEGAVEMFITSGSRSDTVFELGDGRWLKETFRLTVTEVV